MHCGDPRDYMVCNRHDSLVVLRRNGDSKSGRRGAVGDGGNIKIMSILISEFILTLSSIPYRREIE